ncbi:MAG TPA: heavy metal translocating P-type ATPase [Brumimicrobium sp.]|nr:heavy metal translocating P-type ATPase [Brumimicrobium sp.]
MIKQEENPSEEACCSSHDGHGDHGHSHEIDKLDYKLFLPAILSFVLLISAVVFDYWVKANWFDGILRIAWYVLAYAPVGFPVIKEAYNSVRKGNLFSEFFLMTIATVGAFAIGEYPEAVSVMLFYAIGEIFQSIAVTRAQNNIKTLLDQRPEEITVMVNGIASRIKAEEAKIGDVIQLKSGEKLGLDGELLSDRASFDTVALTGESVPDSKKKGESVLAGMINLNTVAQVRVTKAYEDSQLSKILALVQNASSQKAPTELFINKFAKVYTPIVVYLAIAITLLPFFFVNDYIFQDWLYKALIFLVISCPCALVISIPLGYFGGIGAASRHGILVKGGNYLDVLASVKEVVMDKTGTLTEGVFKVQEVVIGSSFNRQEILDLVNAIESHSSHPVATAIHEYVGAINPEINLENIEEIAGHGLKATVNGKELLVGNFKLIKKFNVPLFMNPDDIVFTTIAVAYGGEFVGYLTIADQIKVASFETIQKLKKLGITPTMLSGDKSTVVDFVANELKISEAYGDLLPGDKIEHVKRIKAKGEKVAFVGDGLNDAPVIAISDVGIAMGGLGSDVTIETADVVIQNDEIHKIPMAIEIGKSTKRIVWQNIGFAFGVKALVLILGAGGLATMWEAVFADVGVALIAIANATRIMRKKFT